MPYETEFESGQHNVLCSTCQAVFKWRDIERNWDKRLVCYDCKDPTPIYAKKEPKLPNDMKPIRDIQGPEPIDSEEI